MKKITMIFGLVFAALLAEAQQTDSAEKKEKRRQPWFSVYGALNWNYILGETQGFEEGMPGVAVGIRIRAIRLSDRFYINLEGGLSQQGAGYQLSDDDAPFYQGSSGKVRLSYINVALIARHQSWSGFFIEAGVQPGFLISAEDKFEGNTADIKDFVKKLDLSALAGLGFEFKNRIGVGLRVAPGLSNINREQNNYEVNNDRHLVCSLRVSYGF